MSRVNIIYWSQTGNTKMMADAIAEGAGAQAEENEVGSVSADSLKDANILAIGCPAMGAETLEESEMEPFVSELEKFAAGKNIALFGSYGWGDGQWMRDWVDRMNTAGANVVNGEGLICNEEPDSSVLSACESLGKQLAGM